jgi:anti-sigma regulatory factor (Ser/Thr protein kinase)
MHTSWLTAWLNASRCRLTTHRILNELPADFPIVMADEPRIEQVVSNLISNAIKYAPGGDIRITGQNLPDLVVICVADEGPGIAAGDLPHIFRSLLPGTGDQPEDQRRRAGACTWRAPSWKPITGACGRMPSRIKAPASAFLSPGIDGGIIHTQSVPVIDRFHARELTIQIVSKLVSTESAKNCGAAASQPHRTPHSSAAGLSE